MNVPLSLSYRIACRAGPFSPKFYYHVKNIKKPSTFLRSTQSQTLKNASQSGMYVDYLSHPPHAKIMRMQPSEVWIYVLNPKSQKSLDNIESITPRILIASFNSNRKTWVICCYNPTNVSDEAEIGNFVCDLSCETHQSNT